MLVLGLRKNCKLQQNLRTKKNLVHSIDQYKVDLLMMEAFKENDSLGGDNEMEINFQSTIEQKAYHWMKMVETCDTGEKWISLFFNICLITTSLATTLLLQKISMKLF